MSTKAWNSSLHAWKTLMMVGEKINSVTIDLSVSQVCAFITIFGCFQMIHISSDIEF